MTGTGMMTLRRAGTLAVISSLLAAGPLCAQPSVWVSIPPQVEMVHRVVGDAVRVQALAQPGHSAATFEPTPKQMAALSQADLYLTIGVPFERSLMGKLRDAAPHLRVVDGTRGIELQPMPGGHHHGGAAETPDPHFWLDPLLVSVHAGTVADALCQLVPEDCRDLQANLAAYRSQLEAVHHRIAEQLAPLEGHELFVYHPAYGYFARRYGLRQVAVEVAGKEPSARQLAETIERAKASGARVLFVQPQFSGSTPVAVADAVGCVLDTLDPLAPNHLDNLLWMANRIATYAR